MVITNITTIWASHSINRYKPSNSSANSLKTSICNKNIAYIMIHHTTSCASNSILWHSWHYAHNMIDHVHHHYIIQHHGHHRAFNHIITKFYLHETSRCIFCIPEHLITLLTLCLQHDISCNILCIPEHSFKYFTQCQQHTRSYNILCITYHSVT